MFCFQYIFISSALDGVSLMYQRVQRIECSNPRPVLLLGPLVEVCKDVLVKESPAKFSRCPPGELTHWVETFLLPVSGDCCQRSTFVFELQKL